MESNNNIFETGEKILFQRANPSKKIVEQTTNPYLKKFDSEKCSLIVAKIVTITSD